MFRSLAACTVSWLLLGLLPLVAASAAPPPLEAFARLPAIRGVGISPNGKRLVYITGHEDREVAVTFDRTTKAAPTIITASDPGRFDRWWTRRSC
jgi:hypothetical protein